MKQSDFFETVWGEQSGHAVTQPKTAHDGNWRSPQDTSETTDQFFSPVVFSEKHRAGTDTAATCQVLYVDADRADLDGFWSDPSIIVTTSPGSRHLYWVLDSPVSMAEASTLSQRIARKHKMEASAGISAKLLRVPGTLNDSSEKVKDSGEPFPVTAESTGLIYSYADLAAEYPATPDEPKAVERADAPVPSELPKSWDLLDRVPGDSRAYRLLEWDPAEHPEDDRSSRLFELLNALMEEGFNAEETAVLAWESKLTSKYHEQSRPFSQFWNTEILKAIANQRAKEEPDEYHEPIVVHDIDLLSMDERAFLRTHRTFVDDFIDDAYEVMHPKTPEVYFEAHAISLLGCALAPHFGLYSDSGYEQLNTYVLNAGSQATGKTAALAYQKTYIRALDSLFDTHIDTGSSFSAPGLIKALKDKHNESSFIYADEAAATFRAWQQEAYNGARQLLMQLYNVGWVPKHLLSGKDSGNTEDVYSYLSVFLMGTPDATFGAMTKDLIADGMTARFIPLLAESIPQDFEDKFLYRTRKGDEKVKRSDDKQLEFAQEVQRLISWAAKVNPEPGVLTLEMTEEAHYRYAQFSWAIDQDARTHREPVIAAAHARRLPMNVAKTATLLAAQRYSDVVEVSDMLTALKYGEQWWKNVLVVIDAVSDNEYTRTLDSLQINVVNNNRLMVLVRLFHGATYYSAFFEEPHGLAEGAKGTFKGTFTTKVREYQDNEGQTRYSSDVTLNNTKFEPSEDAGTYKDESPF